MQLNTRRKPITLALAALALSASAATQAQQLEEVVVTAQKRAQSVNDIGLSVTAFSGDMVDKLGFTETSDIALQTPGLEVQPTFGNAYPAFIIRGVGVNDYSPNTNPGVAVYVDEAYVPTAPMLSFGLYDIDRIEVLKGPQGTLYGRNTTGGAIAVHTRKPTDEVEGYIKGGAGNYDYSNLEAAIGGGLTDNVRARVSGFWTNQDEGFQEDVLSSRDLGEIDQYGARAQLGFDLGDNFDALVRYTYGRDKSDSAYYRPNSLEGSRAYLYTNYNGPDLDENEILLGNQPTPKFDNTLNSWGLNMNWDLGFATLTSVTAYDDFDYGGMTDWASTELTVQTVDYAGNIDNRSQELRLTSNEGDLVDWIVGLYWSKTDTTSDNALRQDYGFGYVFYAYGFYDAPFPGVAGATNSFDQTLETAGIFIHTEWHLSEKFKGTLGIRYSEDDLDYGMSLDGTGEPCSSLCTDSGFPDITESQTGFWEFVAPSGRTGNQIASGKGKDQHDAVPWKVGLDYLPNNDWLVYGSVSKGFKSHGFFGGLAPFDEQFEPYKPEELLAYEVGFKATLAEGRVQLNGAVFYYDYEDQQVIVSQDIMMGVPNDVLSNLNESEITGAELDFTWVPLDGLQINLGYSYLDTEITDKGTSSPLPLFTEFDDDKLSMAPEHSFNGLVRYQWNVSSALYAAVQTSFSYRDEALSYAGRSATEMDSRTVIDGRISVGTIDEHWEVALWGKNLADEEYANFKTVLIDPMTMDAPPRTYGVELRYNFF